VRGRRSRDHVDARHLQTTPTRRSTWSDRPRRHRAAGRPDDRGRQGGSGAAAGQRTAASPGRWLIPSRGLPSPEVPASGATGGDAHPPASADHARDRSPAPAGRPSPRRRHRPASSRRIKRRSEPAGGPTDGRSRRPGLRRGRSPARPRDHDVGHRADGRPGAGMGDTLRYAEVR
jgi:hypothetical protein